MVESRFSYSELRGYMMIQSLRYVYSSQEVHEHDDVDEAILDLEWSSDAGGCFPIGVYNSDNGTIYVRYADMGFNNARAEDMVKTFKLDSYLMYMYRVSNDKIKICRIILFSHATLGKTIWFYENSELVRGIIDKVGERYSRNLNGEPIRYYMMGDPHPHIVTYNYIVVNGVERSANLPIFESKEDAQEWKEFVKG